MKNKNVLIDNYISKSSEFAKPVLNHVRVLIHKVCPEVEEKMKWSFPHFDYKGEMMCSMAAFKNHCAVSFWKASLMEKSQKLLEVKNRTAMGNLGRIMSMDDLPSDKIMISIIKEAMKLNDEGIKLSKPKSLKKPDVKVPEYFQKKLLKNPKAKQTFESFSPSHKREYVEWIIDAKTEATREKRIASAIEMINEGKQKNWKYIKK